MIYTPKIQKAIKFANSVHRGQIRKGKPGEVYILHPLSVGLILSRVEASENTIVAGILHDTIEDCEPYGTVTKDTIEKEFGKDVARMVDDATEQDKTMPWAKRKQLALDHMEKMEKDSLLVKSADILHNMSDLIADIEEEGDRAFEKFNAERLDVYRRFQSVLKELERLWPDNPLLPEIRIAVIKVTNQ